MEDEFRNRLDSFTTALTFANHAERKPVWQNVVPMGFTTKMTEAGAMVPVLQAWCQKQSQSVLGAAEDKKREREELTPVAFAMAQALVTYHMDQDDLTAAEPFRRGEPWWQTLPDQTLLMRAQDVIDAATLLTSGANAVSIAQNYGISAAAVAALVAERQDFADFVAAPAAVRSARKAYTMALREKFRPVTAKFRELDRLVVQFRSRPNGPQFVDGWFAARNVVDAGHGSGTGGGSGGPTLPEPPTGLTISQENPGDAVALGASVGAGVTLVKFFAKPAGSSETPTLITSAAELPTSASGVGPGEYEWTATAVSAAGESAPSAPVLFTVQ